MSFQKYQNTIEKKTPFHFDRETSIGVGGISPVAYYPRTMAEMIGLLRELKTPYYLLGNGTNVLPPEKSDRVVVKTTRLSFIKEDTMFVSCGAQVSTLLKLCKKGYTGAEFLAGIPASIGGLLYMNGGANGRFISSIVKGVVVFQKGEIVYRKREDCDYSYKHSRFMSESCVILGAYFSLIREDPQKVQERIEKVLEGRKRLPKGRSMGCVFKNPEGDSAGRLIDLAGLKGARIGGAVVSPEHANFIIAERGAKREDIVRLIDRMKREVYKKFQIRLEEEIRYIP